ncbi:hypothetical protein [Shimia sp. Alg240-R146]|uniref:hypothetical protein n=1 Tax=Shimia sp. Alg240-R146 TaxID=2993449 RepID=UPI0022E164AE|nr:hypothetical protein [Shimia sp. Alg240-R146]
MTEIGGDLHKILALRRCVRLDADAAAGFDRFATLNLQLTYLSDQYDSQNDTNLSFTGR